MMAEVIELSNSNLVKYVDLSTSNYNTRTDTISRITIHHAAGVGNCEMLSRVLSSTSESSYNYGIGNDGTIGLFVEEKNRAWTSANPENDHKAITIEVCNSTGHPTWEVSQAAWNSLINLCVDICRRNKINRLTYTGQLAGSNLTRHDWFMSTLCPGPYLGARFTDIMNQVNSKLIEGYVPEPQIPVDHTKPNGGSSSSSLPSGSHSYIDPKALIDTSKITPYIATYSTTAKHIDCSKLVDHGVVGVALHAGELFDTTHGTRKRYVNANLSEQYAAVQKANLPHALLATVRARSTTEAKAECEQLYYVISKYPPQLGLWLQLDLVKPVKINDSIINIYYQCILEWGLKGKCGIYCTYDQLKKITWEDHSSNFLLWLQDHTSTGGVTDSLLTPEFFKLKEGK